MSDDYAKIMELLFDYKLDEIVAYGAAAIPHLIDALMDEDVGVRANAAWVLSKIGNVSAVPALIETLEEDENGGMRSLAAAALGEIGNTSAAPALFDALKDGNPVVRKWAAEALEKIAEKADVDLRAVGKALREYVDSVKKKGHSSEMIRAQKEAVGHYIQISKAVAKFKGGLHSEMEGMQLEGTFKPPSGRNGMYRACKNRVPA